MKRNITCERVDELGFSYYETLCVYFFCVVLNTQHHVYSLCTTIIVLHNVFVTFNVYNTPDRLGNHQKIEPHTKKRPTTWRLLFFLSSFHPISNCVSLFYALIACVRFWHWRACVRSAHINQHKFCCVSYKNRVYSDLNECSTLYCVQRIHNNSRNFHLFRNSKVENFWRFSLGNFIHCDFLVFCG